MSDYDYSEYTPNEYEKYKALREDNKYFDYSYFLNKAFFHSDRNYFHIEVDKHNEYEEMEFIINAVKEKHPETHGAHIGDPDEDTEDDIEEEKSFNKKIRDIAEDKYDILLVGNDSYKPMINIYSGAHINLHYGEGLLDFIYADFDTPIKKVYTREKQSEIFFERMRSDEEIIQFLKNYSERVDRPKKEKKTEKIYDDDQIILYDFEIYENTFYLIYEILYASLYSAICPPLLKDLESVSKSIRIYANYILTLQREYRDLIEFCYDENFFPDILGRLSPAERYSIFRSIKGYPTVSHRDESFEAGIATVGENNPPYSIDIDTFRKKVTKTIPEKDIAPLAEKYNMNPGKLAAIFSIPRGINVYYKFGSLSEILDLEFTQMLEKNIRFRKCKRCGRYFIMKGNYDTNYCDRIEPGTNRTCKDLAAQENYKKKTEGNEAIALYHKYYKRYAARVKVRQIKEQDFKKWKYEAIVKRDECSNGKITPAEFTDWLEACFPNRKKK